LQRCKVFLESYARAIKAWMLGAADVVFPAGTYWMRRFARVVCEAVDSANDQVDVNPQPADTG
jgi:hypothetical protein